MGDGLQADDLNAVYTARSEVPGTNPIILEAGLVLLTPTRQIQGPRFQEIRPGKSHHLPDVSEAGLGRYIVCPKDNAG